MMNARNTNEWKNYRDLVAELNRELSSYNDGIGKGKKCLNWAANGVFTLFGREEVSFSLQENIAKKLLELQEELLRLRKFEIRFGPGSGNFIDVNEFIEIINTGDEEKIKLYVKDHFSTLVIQRNSLLSKSINLDPYLSMLGLLLTGVGAGVAVAAIAIYSI